MLQYTCYNARNINRASKLFKKGKAMRNPKKDISAEKENGRFYTPDFIVDSVLDMSGYCGETILKKHVIDNSCGDGAFLIRIAQRYYLEAKRANYSYSEIKSDLETYIHGIEIENSERVKCVNRLDDFFDKEQMTDIHWDIISDDTLTVTRYNGKMDYVLGNPPYIRVHNLGNYFDSIKSFSFAQGGMTDMYIVFYEIGIKMLSKNGTLGYITPSSFFNSVAGSYMRKVFVSNNYLDKICDLKHYQAFKSMTYTAITVLKNNKSDGSVKYYQFDEESKSPNYAETLTPKEFYITGNYFFAAKEQLKLLSDVLLNSGVSDIKVKNGYATLCDNVFIRDFDFTSRFIIPVVKASKGIVKKAFFPYTNSGELIDEKEIKSDSKMYSYLKANEEKLLNRSNENSDRNHWYAYGRSQAIGDTFKDKLSINSLIRSEDDIKFADAPAGTGVYGGLYLTSDTVPMSEIKKALKSKEFTDYVLLLGKYKSGGYYTFSSKDVKTFLDYKFAYDGGFLCVQTNNF